MVWFEFAICVALITVAGSTLSRYGDAIADKTGLGRTWVGVILLATVTSLPELVTSAVAAAKKEGDISIGNILGSNIFNFLIVGGLTALIKPFTISERILNFDTPIMLFFTLLLFVVVATGRRVSRLEGFIYASLYITYIVLVFKFPNGIPLF